MPQNYMRQVAVFSPFLFRENTPATLFYPAALTMAVLGAIKGVGFVGIGEILGIFPNLAHKVIDTVA